MLHNPSGRPPPNPDVSRLVDCARMNPNKTRYRTTNWSEYNRSLQSRGSLTVWMSPDILWLDSVRSGANGRPKVYSDAAIQAILTLKVLFKLALRQARGLVSAVC